VVALEREDREMVQKLLFAGADVNARSKGWVTPVAVALQQGSLEMLQLLLDVDADICMPVSFDGSTPLFLGLPFPPMVAELLRAGANVNAVQREGSTALHVAAECGYVESLQMLLGAGAGVHMRDSTGRTALHCAAREGHVAAVEALLSYGANPGASDRKGRSIRMVAARQRHGAVVARVSVALEQQTARSRNAAA
jgi:ankyrin repeat protein